MPVTFNSLSERLDYYYRQVQTVILARQNPVSGLLPASTAVNVHGDYTDAWVRDNVYSILAVWGLALAYRKIDENQGRTYELEQSVVKLMRGLLTAMMGQAHKVERFKHTQHPLDALHAKYDTATGQPVVGDHEWGHLQVDATSIYLLMLAQMTASGLQIIFTLDEVNFIQNLTYYIGRAYRTPDYGIWERGNKLNHGNPELNASSVGMAKAALEAMQGLNLFGVRGGQASVIHVLSDEIARARITLESLLPRESGSKEVDAAVLSVIGFPAFAVDNPDLVTRTRDKIVDKLQGRYGCKRFLRDGHQTVLEDSHRLYYEPQELRQFEHIECEWPLFFTYLWLDSLFRHDTSSIQDYEQRLQSLTVESQGSRLLPELYYVPANNVDAERAQPHSQTRLPNDNIPLVWAQSLYLLGQYLQDGLLKPGDLDPLNRHLNTGQHRQPIVQLALLAEDETLQAELAVHGIETQTPDQLEPLQIRSAEELAQIYGQIGRNDKLNLTGRPRRRLRSLTTSRIFRIQGETMVFLPAFLDLEQFYLTLDYHFLVAQVRSELAYIHEHWHEPGRPTVTLLLTHAMFELGHKPIHESPLLKLLLECKEGQCGSVSVRLDPLYQLMLTAGTERIDNLHSYRFETKPLESQVMVSSYLALNLDSTRTLTVIEEFDIEVEKDAHRLQGRLQKSVNIYEQIEVLATLKRIAGLDFAVYFEATGHSVGVGQLLHEVYVKAGRLELWAIVRRAAGLLNKVDLGLSDAVTELLVRQKQIAVGKAYSEAARITDPMPMDQIRQKIDEFCGEDVRDRVLSQEIIIYLSVLIKSEPQLFDGLLTLRVGYLILLLTSELVRELKLTQDEAYEHLMALSPFDIKMRLRQVLAGYSGLNKSFFRQESLRVRQRRDVNWAVLPEQVDEEPADGDWWRKRQIDGELNRIPEGFYTQLWTVFKRCRGIVIGDKLERRNRLESSLILSEMTAGERNFALMLEHLLSKIQAPEYRHVNTEALTELVQIFARNPDLYFDDYIVMDVLVGHAVRIAWLDRMPERSDRYDEDKAIAWRSFYQLPSRDCAASIAKALQFLSELGQADDLDPGDPVAVV